MSILDIFRKKHKEKEIDAKEKLEVGAVGGTVTPVVHPSSPGKIAKDRLLNRLSIIDGQIKKYKNAKSTKRNKAAIEHWEEKKSKVKALLWIYYDENKD